MRWGAPVPRERFGGRVYRPNMKRRPQKQTSGASVAPPFCKTAQKCRFCFDSNNRILAPWRLCNECIRGIHTGLRHRSTTGISFAA